MKHLLCLSFTDCFDEILAFVGGIRVVMLTSIALHLIKKGSAIIWIFVGVIVLGFMSTCMGLITYVAGPEIYANAYDILEP